MLWTFLFSSLCLSAALAEPLVEPLTNDLDVSKCVRWINANPLFAAHLGDLGLPFGRIQPQEVTCAGNQSCYSVTLGNYLSFADCDERAPFQQTFALPSFCPDGERGCRETELAPLGKSTICCCDPKKPADCKPKK